MSNTGLGRFERVPAGEFWDDATTADFLGIPKSTVKNEATSGNGIIRAATVMVASRQRRVHKMTLLRLLEEQLSDVQNAEGEG